MTPEFISLFTRPDRAWETIRQKEDANSLHYLFHLLVLALIPAVCLFIGVTVVGWSLVEDERVRLDAGERVAAVPAALSDHHHRDAHHGRLCALDGKGVRGTP